MALEIPQFNAGGENGLTTLHPTNGGMGALLASTGNTISVQVGALASKGSTFSTPGGHWTARRVTGRRPRRAVWDWQIAAADQSDLNQVEAAIEAYIDDGREYVLTDGKGRSSNYGVLLDGGAGTGRIGRRVSTSDGRKLQRWRLVFDVLYPSVGATAL